MIYEKWVVLDDDDYVYFESDWFLDCADLVSSVYEMDPSLKGAFHIRFISSGYEDED